MKQNQMKIEFNENITQYENFTNDNEISNILLKTKKIDHKKQSESKRNHKAIATSQEQQVYKIKLKINTSYKARMIAAREATTIQSFNIFFLSCLAVL